jgi:hypothetical protein
MRLFTGAEASELDESNYVVVYSWPQSERNVAGHISMKIVCDGVEHHISYWHERDYKQSEKDGVGKQYYGVEPYWVGSLEDDCLIEGYRHFSTENPKANAKVILEAVKAAGFKRKLEPEVSIRLNSLDAKAMLDAFRAYKASDHKWGFISGVLVNAPGVHNCASVVLHLLMIGGIEKMAGSYGEWMRNLGIGASLVTAPFWASSLLPLAGYTALSGIAGALFGGSVDGILDIQNFIRVTEIQAGKSVSTRLGLTMASTIISALGSLFAQQHLTGKLLTMPDTVMTLVKAAHDFERQNYTQSVEMKL